MTFADGPIGDRVIHPFLPSQGRGIEEARFCRFVEEDGAVDYRCTFTAFDGSDHRQSVLRTRDFRSFTGRWLHGDAACGKGAAWFPRRVAGRYLMLGRLDDETISLMWSDDADRWQAGETIIRPRYPWEFVQMGNCGSPIEIDEGWLVLTHGIVRGRTLLLPYGIADNYTAFGTVDIDRLLAAISWLGRAGPVRSSPPCRSPRVGWREGRRKSQRAPCCVAWRRRSLPATAPCRRPPRRR